MKEPIALEGILLQETPEEKHYDFHPQSFEHYLGQTELKNKLSVYTMAAKMRKEPLDHLLLFGPPGLGKTTLSMIMAQVMEVNIKICSGPTLERSGDLVAILSSLEARDILFIDEIHRLPAHVEEILYNAMEHFRVDVIIGQGAGAKSINLPLQPFTLVGATTKSGMISAPLRSRFGITERLEFYADTDLCAIIQQNAAFLKIQIEENAALLIAKSARGTPRIGKKLLHRIRDFAQVQHISMIDVPLVQKTLAFLGINQDGLTRVDIAILKTIVEQFHGGPVGLETIAAIVGEDKETIETVYEPFLLRSGYLIKSARGRHIAPQKLPLLQSLFLGQKTFVT